MEDDAILQRNLVRGLSDQKYKVRVASSLEAAERMVVEFAVDLILLDLGLPDGGGLTFLELVRRNQRQLPVIILTARDAVSEKIQSLDLGADDYLVKPFDFQELSARIRAHLRRSAVRYSSVVQAGGLEIDLVRRTVARDGVTIDCTPREFDVLVYLINAPGQVVSRDMLMRDVWKIRSRMTSMDNVIDVLMSRLREKIDDGHASRLIRTVRGIGYMLDAQL